MGVDQPNVMQYDVHADEFGACDIRVLGNSFKDGKHTNLRVMSSGRAFCRNL